MDGIFLLHLGQNLRLCSKLFCLATVLGGSDLLYFLAVLPTETAEKHGLRPLSEHVRSDKSYE